MKTVSIARRMAPYAVALMLFFALAALYFHPQFSGQVLPQHDVQMYEGMVRDIRQERASTGEDPQWTGAMFGGMPAYLINVAYPAEWVKQSVGQLHRVVDEPAAFLFFAMVAFWGMLLLAGIRPWVGIVPAMAYGLSTYFLLIIGAGHLTKMWAAVYAPPMLGALFYAFRYRRWTGGALFALFASLEIGAGHPQITYYFVLIMAAFWCSELVGAVRRHAMPAFFRTTGVVAVAALLAVGSNFSPLWYTAQHSGETIRGGSELAMDTPAGKGLDLEYATAWSYGPAESFNLLIPDFAGGDSGRTFSLDGPVADALRPYGLQQVAAQLPVYWGGQPYTAGPTYLGAAMLFLAVLGALLVRGRCRWWILTVSLAALLLAWGRHWMGLTELFFRIVPGYNKFRTVSMILVIVQWSVPFLGALALHRLCRTAREQRASLLRPLFTAAALVGGLCLLMALAGGALFDFGRASDVGSLTEQWRQMLLHSGGASYVAQGLHEELGAATADGMALERAALMRTDALRSLLFVLLAAGTVWVYLRRRIGCPILLVALGIWVVADLWGVDARYLGPDRFVSPRRAGVVATAADRAILADTVPGYRVLNLTVSPFNDATTSYFHRSVGGYHGAKLARYQDVIDRYLAGVTYGIDSSAQRVIDLLNTRYLIVPGTDGQPEARRNPGAMGAAWFVERIRTVPDARAEIEALGQLDIEREAVVDERFADRLTGLGPDAAFTGAIRLVDYHPQRLRYRYEASAPRAALFSEIYYDKGWTAFIDGVEAPTFRADYLLRGMVLPAGAHAVEWRFRAPHFGRVEAVTLLSSILVLIAAVAALVAALFRRRQPHNATPES